MIYNTRSVPAKKRSKYDNGGGTSSARFALGNNHTHTNLPTLNAIDESKIITWDEAVALKHQHDNWEQIRTIDQDLSTTSTPSFACLNITNQANVWRLSVTGGIAMNNKTISGANSISFQPYETGGVMHTNTISNQNGEGLGFNCRIKVDGSLELLGTNRDIYSYNYDMNIIHYRHDWSKGSILTLTDTAVVTNNLSVTGSFNCYELVANKVRSTNGLLYVTDSDEVSSVDNIGESYVDINTGNTVIVSNGNIAFKDSVFVAGDYLVYQVLTANSVQKKTIKLVSGNGADFKYKIIEGSAPAANDYFVKIDSTDASRRTGILLSPYQGGYIDFYTGAGDGINKTVTTSLGDLNHLNRAGVSGNGLFSQNTFLTGKSQRIPKKINLSGNDSEARINLFECNWTIVNNSTYGSASGVTIKFDDEGLPAYDGAECTIVIINNNVNSSFYVTDKQTDREVKIWGDTTSFGSGVFLCAAKTVVTLELRYCYDLYRKTYASGRYSSGWVVVSKQVYNQ